MSSASSFLSFRLSGTSPLTMRSARPSTIAVLPTPGSPISTGLFLVRRDSTWMVRRISSSRPITGSSLPSRAACGEVARIFLQRVIGVLGRGGVGGAALAQRLMAAFSVLRRDAGLGQRLAGLGVLLDREREQQPLDRDEAVAGLLGGLLGGVEDARELRRRDRPGRRRRRRPSAAWRAPPRRRCSAWRELPPARSIRPGRQALGVVEQHLEQMLGRELLMALAQGQDCADCTKPRARSVYFSMFIVSAPSAHYGAGRSELNDGSPKAARLRTYVGGSTLGRFEEPAIASIIAPESFA